MPIKLDEVLRLLRPSYEVVHGPLQFVEDEVMSRRARRNPLRVGYELLLVGLDDAAGRLLGDEAAATRADALRARTAAARAEIADYREREARRWARAGQARMQRYRLYRDQQAARRVHGPGDARGSIDPDGDRDDGPQVLIATGRSRRQLQTKSHSDAVVGMFLASDLHNGRSADRPPVTEPLPAVTEHPVAGPDHRKDLRAPAGNRG